jgi:serine protease AprX
MVRRPRAKKVFAKKRRTKASEMADDDNSKSALRPAPELEGRRPLGMEQSTIPKALDDEDRRHAWGLPGADQAGNYMIELNLMHQGGLKGAQKRFDELCEDMGIQTSPKQVSKSYYSWSVSLNDLRRLVKRDEDRDDAKNDRTKLAIYKVWPDFPIRPTLDKSVSTIKADAAVRTFAASGQGIVWAVIDSGVRADHAHFAERAASRFHCCG